jgi:dihydroorotate dehydrogenase (fumarate)
MLMAGATVTTMASALLRHGIRHLSTVEAEMKQWLEEHEYESITQLRGSMSQRSCPDPSSFERAQYMRAISTFKAA